jgi:hypothetical protein
VIQIDKSAIPEHLLSDPAVLAAEEAFLEKLSEPQSMERTCIHEAGHEYYSRKFGLVTEWLGPNAAYLPPGSPALRTLGLTPQEGRISIAMASVQPIPATYQGDGLGVRDYGKLVGAGIAAERVFFGADRIHPPTSMDFINFLTTWKNDYPDTSDDEFLAYFELCIAEVQKECENPTVREEIQRIAKEFQKQVFGDCP